MYSDLTSESIYVAQLLSHVAKNNSQNDINFQRSVRLYETSNCITPFRDFDFLDSISLSQALLEEIFLARKFRTTDHASSYYSRQLKRNI